MSSEHDHKAHAQGLLIVISAPSGAGKTSLLRAAIEADEKLGFSVSYTTRPPRAGEVDGQHYHFVSHAQFQQRIAEDDFLEHAEVFGNLYGTSSSATRAALAAGQDLILEIDWQGARRIRAQVSNCVSIFILPPSLAELQRRLESRAQDALEVIQRRMAEAHAEMSHWEEYDYLVVNEDFDHATSQLGMIINAARLQRVQQAARLRELLRDLRIE